MVSGSRILIISEVAPLAITDQALTHFHYWYGVFGVFTLSSSSAHPPCRAVLRCFRRGSDSMNYVRFFALVLLTSVKVTNATILLATGKNPPNLIQALGTDCITPNASAQNWTTNAEAVTWCLSACTTQATNSTECRYAWVLYLTGDNGGRPGLCCPYSNSIGSFPPRGEWLGSFYSSGGFYNLQQTCGEEGVSCAPMPPPPPFLPPPAPPLPPPPPAAPPVYSCETLLQCPYTYAGPWDPSKCATVSGTEYCCCGSSSTTDHLMCTNAAACANPPVDNSPPPPPLPPPGAGWCETLMQCPYTYAGPWNPSMCATVSGTEYCCCGSSSTTDHLMCTNAAACANPPVDNSPPPPPMNSPRPPPSRKWLGDGVTVSLTARGSPTDFSPNVTVAIRHRFATLLGVPVDKVTVTVTAGSVVITVNIEAETATIATAMTTVLLTTLSSSTSATAFLSASSGPLAGIMIESVPAIALSVPPPPPPSPSPPPELAPPAKYNFAYTGHVILIILLVGVCISVWGVIMHRRRLDDARKQLLERHSTPTVQLVPVAHSK